MSDTKETISVLDFLLRHTQEPIYRSALTVARNRLLRDVDSSEAARRSVSDWPCCAKCGAPYAWRQTDNDYVHEVLPACDCGAVAAFQNARPSGMWNDATT